jgi:hypothetical protein
MKSQTWLASRLVYQESDMLGFMISLSPIITKIGFWCSGYLACSGCKTTWSYCAVDLAFTTYMLIFTLAIIWLFQARWAYSNTTSYTGAIRYITCPMIAAHIRIGDKRLDYFFLYTNNYIYDWKQISVLLSMILLNVLELRTENC